MANQFPLALVTGKGGRAGRWVVPTPILRLDDQDEPIRALEPIDRGGLKQATLDARTALQEAAIAAAVAAERALAYAETLDGALAALHRAETAESGLPSSMSPRGGLPSAVLSRREQEVLALVAEGRTNKAIADELFLSPNTVKTHVASLLNKLHADSRAQLAAMAVRGTAR